VSGMETLTRECDRTACSLACELIDKLTVIVGIAICCVKRWKQAQRTQNAWT
jgi:hypothetical protein